MIGAEIYCTFGSDTKAKFLKDAFGISVDRIFNSRDSSFLPAILKATHGRGVDVMLNLLSGELLHASWKCVAEFGRFVEIGRRDFVGQGKLAMEFFEANRSFVGFDLSAVSVKRPQVIQDLMNKAIECYEQGHLKPIMPMHVYDATKIQEPFRNIQKAVYIGKNIITIPQDPSVLKSEASRLELKLRSDRAYLFVGGFDGIGKAISSWLAEKGAKHLVFLSRFTGEVSPENTQIRELHALGCITTAISGSVSDYADVAKAIESTDLPIGDVFQASMFLKDGNFVDTDWEQWQTAVVPKVQGAWNLHNALLSQVEPVEQFFLFSSAGAMSGQMGQSNYNSGNIFLDAFVQYRQSLGLPASAVNIGVIEDVGYVNENPAILESLRATSQYLLREPELLASVELMLKRSEPTNVSQYDQAPAMNSRSPRFADHAQIGIGMRSTLPMLADSNRTIWRKDPRMLVLSGLRRQLAKASTSPLFLV